MNCLFKTGTKMAIKHGGGLLRDKAYKTKQTWFLSHTNFQDINIPTRGKL